MALATCKGCLDDGAREGTGAAGGCREGGREGAGAAGAGRDEAVGRSADVDEGSIAGLDDIDERPVGDGPVLAAGQVEQLDSEQNLSNQETCHRVEILLQ